MSDVSAVVLSLGEPIVGRALDSLARQTVPLSKVIVVENVSPFSRAINEGARQVETPYFIQVDADMILDEACVEVLRRGARDDTGIVVAELRDPLVGPTVGVKLFRTACFSGASMPDSLAQDTDFGKWLERNGWKTEYVKAEGGDPDAPRPTLGEHRPDYTPSYTFRKFLVEGARLRYRAARHGLFWRMGTLEQSTHPMAVLSQLALCHGFFLHSSRDELRADVSDPRGEWLDILLANNRLTPPAAGLLPLTKHEHLRDVFRHFLGAGQAVASSEAGATFREIFGAIPSSRRDSRALVAKVGLAHGLLMTGEDRSRLAADERALRDFMIHSLGSRSGMVDRLRAVAVHAALALRRPRSYVPW